MVLFGQILLTTGLITQKDLELAIEEQKKSPRLLGEILRERGLLSRKDLWEAWTAQLVLKTPQIGALKAPLEVRRLAFGELAEHYNATPISVSQNETVLLINSKNDFPILDDLNVLYGIEQITVVVTSKELEDELKKTYPNARIAKCAKCSESVASQTTRIMITEEKKVLFVCDECYKQIERDTGIFEEENR